ncbi:NAD(P)-dependent oxidoreductase [Streptomyces sp. NBC_00006]|uniref:L-threonate dehydrogenase n=1 Tax=Streptomyces sp. NBC_00006 TaxID=2975619 RepID=UPI0022531093|nr:L-threonate dehydrogenase [Streptomyces sp. NBC_00006]MCX5530183.1 NAD(P)-dependent oxidoreductase [Streptomyces sp. NBC_00006]
MHDQDQPAPTAPTTRVGVVGLGAMGLGMARSLRAAGFHVAVHDLRADVAADFAREGGAAYDTAGDLAADVDVLVGVVVNSAQVESVLFGDGGAAHRLRPGSVYVMCSTVDPTFSAQLEGRLGELGVRLLDAPISGGAARAATGELTMMTSGSPEAYALADPVLDAMSATVYRLGDTAGLGSKVKIVNQLLAGVHIAAAAEAMALGIKAGVPAESLYEVITHSAGNSWMFENRMAHVLAGDYTPLSAVDIFVKDLGLVLDSARPEKFPLPLSATAHQMFLQASASGLGGEDDSAVIKIFPGIELPEPGVELTHHRPNTHDNDEKGA